HLEPKFRRTPGQRWPNPPGLTGCCSRHRGTGNTGFAIRSWHDRLYRRTELTHINDTKRGTTHVIGKIRNTHRCGRSTARIQRGYRPDHPGTLFETHY